MSCTTPLALVRAGLRNKHSVTSLMILNLEKEAPSLAQACLAIAKCNIPYPLGFMQAILPIKARRVLPLNNHQANLS